MQPKPNFGIKSQLKPSTNQKLVKSLIDSENISTKSFTNYFWRRGGKYLLCVASLVALGKNLTLLSNFFVSLYILVCFILSAQSSASHSQAKGFFSLSDANWMDKVIISQLGFFFSENFFFRISSDTPRFKLRTWRMRGLANWVKSFFHEIGMWKALPVLFFPFEKIFFTRLGKCFRAPLSVGSFSIESTICTVGRTDEKRCNSVDGKWKKLHCACAFFYSWF